MVKNPINMTDKELIEWLTRDQVNNVPIGELTRRNTEAIEKFNKASSLLAWAMIGLAFVSILIAILK